MTKILREYTDRLDALLILADLRRYLENKISSKIYTNFFKVGINFLKIFSLQLFII